MDRFGKWSVLCVLLLALPRSFAQEATSTPPGEEPEVCAGVDQLSMNLCAERKWKALDKSLNTLYRQQLARVKGTSYEALLIAAERAWIKFVEADCAYQAGPREEGGTSWAMYALHCRSDYTQKRIDQIREFLACEDNGCPGQ